MIQREVNKIKKVLIVDDSETITKLVQIILESNNFEVFKEHDGSKAMEAIKTHSPNVVILDLMMPGMSGEEVFKEIRKDPKTKNLPVLVLTAKADALNWNKNIGTCDTFMTKPFNNDELVKEVKRLAK